jgi:hypothetical protein
MRIGWGVLGVLGAVMLAGCGSQTKRQDMANCTMEALKAYPHENADDHSRGEAADFEYTCMMAKGYVWVDDQGVCPTITDPGNHFMETRGVCYRKPWPWE